MPAIFTESTFEQAIIALFETMGYTHVYAPDLNRTDYTRPLLDEHLRDNLVRINRGLPGAAIDEAVGKLNDLDSGSLVQKNRTFTDWLQNGVTVKYVQGGEERSGIVRLVDYDRPENNEFLVVNQYTFVENGNQRRPDIILFINGLPLVLMELKSPSQEGAGVEDAYRQIRNYMQDVPSLFYYNQICVISDLSHNQAGTITAGRRTARSFSSRPFTRGCSRKSVCWISCKTSSSFRGTRRSRPRYWRGITSISRYARRSKRRRPRRGPTAGAACSGIPRAAASRCPWCFTPICCKQRWTAPPSW